MNIIIGNAISISNKGILILGEGKTTHSAILVMQGAEYVADDCLEIEEINKIIFLKPRYLFRAENYNKKILNIYFPKKTAKQIDSILFEKRIPFAKLDKILILVDAKREHSKNLTNRSSVDDLIQYIINLRSFPYPNEDKILKNILIKYPVIIKNTIDAVKISDLL